MLLWARERLGRRTLRDIAVARGRRVVRGVVVARGKRGVRRKVRDEQRWRVRWVRRKW